jgi:hypothetical protein
MKTKLFTATIFFILSAAPAYALNTAAGFATLDWTNFTFTTTGSVNVTGTHVFLRQEGGGSIVTPTTGFGSASASGSSVNGFISTAAFANTLQSGGDANRARAIGIADEFVQFVGTGTGTVGVSIPYHVVLSVDDPVPGLDIAFTNVTLLVDAKEASTSVSFGLDATGTATHDGVLTVAVPFSGAPGREVAVSVIADLVASAAVPEASTRCRPVAVGSFSAVASSRCSPPKY